MFRHALLLAASLAATAAGLAPPPALTFLFSSNLTLGAPIPIGNGPLGARQVVPVAGGTFAGPKLSGKILSVGADWGLTDAKGNFSPDAAYVLQAADGTNVLVRGRGHVPSEGILFETAVDGPLAWLNTVVAVAQAKPAAGGIAMDVFQLG